MATPAALARARSTSASCRQSSDLHSCPLLEWGRTRPLTPIELSRAALLLRIKRLKPRSGSRASPWIHNRKPSRAL